MLLLHEVNQIKGSAVTAFEALTQQWWSELEPHGVTPAWYFEVSHGTGPSYRVITAMWIPDWQAWESLARSIAYGPLSKTTEQLDLARYESDSSLLELLSSRPALGPGSPAAPVPDVGGLWVQRVYLDDALPDRGSDQGDRHEVVLRGCGGPLCGRTVVLTRETPGAILDLLTDRPRSVVAGGARVRPGRVDSTWVLRPAAWSPLH